MAKFCGLKRELNVFSVTVAGIGIILGAGIYALIGVAAGEAGNAVWLSFLIGSIVAGFTGMSYAELSAKFEGDAGEYDYCKSAFGSKTAFILALFIMLTGVISAATVALGFAGYFTSVFNFGNIILCAGGLIILMSFLNYFGIKDSNRFNLVATSIEFIGLIIIIVLGVSHFGDVNVLEMPNGLDGVLKAGALVFFAFMGFETIIKLREESKNPKRTIPLAIIFSILITTVIYILVSIAAVSIMPYEQLASSSAPLADVAASVLGQKAFILLAIIALFSTSNTVLLTMVTTSRMVYGMGAQRSLPKFLARVDCNRNTPYTAIILVGIVTIAFAFIGDITFVADLTTVLLFLTFALVNLALIRLRYKKGYVSPFRIPLNYGRFPVLSALGVITSLYLLIYGLINLF